MSEAPETPQEPATPEPDPPKGDAIEVHAQPARALLPRSRSGLPYKERRLIERAIRRGRRAVVQYVIPFWIRGAAGHEPGMTVKERLRCCEELASRCGVPRHKEISGEFVSANVHLTAEQMLSHLATMTPEETALMLKEGMAGLEARDAETRRRSDLTIALGLSHGAPDEEIAAALGALGLMVSPREATAIEVFQAQLLAERTRHANSKILSKEEYLDLIERRPVPGALRSDAPPAPEAAGPSGPPPETSA